jgi:hypothetical protein
VLFFIRIALSILGLLCFHINFRIDFSILSVLTFGVYMFIIHTLFFLLIIYGDLLALF